MSNRPGAIDSIDIGTGRRNYSQLPLNEDTIENAIELTELPSERDDNEDVLIDEFNDEIHDDDTIPVATRHDRAPMETIEEHLLWNVFNRWEEPNLLSLAVTTFFVIPTLMMWMYGAFEFAGKWWAIWIMVLHLQVRLLVSMWYTKSASTVSFKHRKALRLLCSVVTLFEVIMYGAVYPLVCEVLTELFFRDVDGTIITEWKAEVRFMVTGVVLGWMVVVLRCCIGLPCLVIRAIKYKNPDTYREWRPIYWTPFGEEGSLQDGTRKGVHSLFWYGNQLAFALNFICILSLVSHFGPWPAAVALPEHCDPLDATECMLPFPSYHHMKYDEYSPTGWKVDLKGLPPLRGGIPFHLNFLNELDGFSTMGPILFYLEGLKEAHDTGDHDWPTLPFSSNAYSTSVTNRSVTLFLDLDESKLVPHIARVDHLDAEHPLVMLFPAEPLKHATRYAILVIDARDEFGQRLPRSKGLIDLMKKECSNHSLEQIKTCLRFTHNVLFVLEKAAPWFSYKDDPESLQLVFDFVTISEESQLGPVRKTRDIALEHIQAWKWEDHVRVVSVIDEDCNGKDPPATARTVHLSLDVPSLLHTESRYSFLDPHKLDGKDKPGLGEAKAMVQIPCSVKKETLEHGAGKPLRAVVEFGHGLFGTREEMKDYFLQAMGDDNGYITMAMDWRGMSRFDLPVVLRTLLGRPDSFQAIRDNLIQGFVNKLCLQHFSQNGMLNLEAFRFDGKQIPYLDDGEGRPTSIFYGISQGGILGGGYVSLAGKTGLIDRGILGSPGSPFALVLASSRDFKAYDTLLLFNFYNNRHVRMALALLQMAWDSTEASGFQARPVSEPIPRLLIQAGTGDPIVPTEAAESLARAMGASLLPSRPAEVFGLSVETNQSSSLGSDVTLSELLYENETFYPPLDNEDVPNNVHWCVRWDKAMIGQVEEFINTGKVIDPCGNDGCRRPNSTEC